MSTKHADLASLKIDRSKRDFPTGGSRKYGRYVILILVAGLIAGAFFLRELWLPLFSPGIQGRLATASLQSPVQVGAVLTASGYVVAQRKAAVASKGTGQLTFLGVVEGDNVRKGQIIARLDNSDISAQLQEAEANLKLQEADLEDAQKNVRRQKALLKAGASAVAELEAAETQLKKILAGIEVAKARVSAGNVAMENTLIRAPFDGTVLTKNADIGEIVAPLAAGANSRAAVVTIADMKSLQVEADVSESNIVKIGVSQDCEITLDAYPNQRYAGRVEKIVPTADRSKATVLVKVGFKDYDARVLPEMSAKVLFLKDSQNQQTAENSMPLLVVPETAVAVRSGRTVVFRVVNNRASEQAVITGKRFGGYIEITEGVEDGARVIDGINETIVDGVKIELPN